MFDQTIQPLRERMPGFEHELDELEEALQAQIDEHMEEDLKRLLPEVLQLFGKRKDAAAYERLVHLLANLDFDTRQLVPLLSARVYEHGEQEGHTIIEHLLQAQNAAEPHRRLQLMQSKEEAQEQAWQKVFREVGLDGVGLMKLLSMKPGPEFGHLLREIQRVARGEAAQLPKLDEKKGKVLRSRIEAARAKLGQL